MLQEHLSNIYHVSCLAFQGICTPLAVTSLSQNMSCCRRCKSCAESFSRNWLHGHALSDVSTFSCYTISWAAELSRVEKSVTITNILLCFLLLFRVKALRIYRDCCSLIQAWTRERHVLRRGSCCEQDLVMGCFLSSLWASSRLEICDRKKNGYGVRQ